MLHSSLICISTSVHNALTHPCPSGENLLIFKIQVSSPPSMKLFWSCSSFILLYVTSMCFKLSRHTPATAAKLLQSCPTLCDPTDGSPPGSPIPGILQAQTLEWAALSFSNAWQWKVKVKSLSHVRLLANPWTAAHQAPLPMGFSRQEDWSGVPSPSPSSYFYLSNIMWHITDLFFDMLSFQDYTCLKGRRHLLQSESLQCSAAQQDFLPWLKRSLVLPNALVASRVFCGLRTWDG